MDVFVFQWPRDCQLGRSAAEPFRHLRDFSQFAILALNFFSRHPRYVRILRNNWNGQLQYKLLWFTSLVVSQCTSLVAAAASSSGQVTVENFFCWIPLFKEKELFVGCDLSGHQYLKGHAVKIGESLLAFGRAESHRERGPRHQSDTWLRPQFNQKRIPVPLWILR